MARYCALIISSISSLPKRSIKRLYLVRSEILMGELSGYQSLLSKIREKRAEIVILGQGYIGLPLALLLCRAGYHVTGFDIKESLIKDLKEGKVKFSEVGLEELLKECLASGRYSPEDSVERALSNRDIYIIAVQTPVKINGRPNLGYLLSALELVLSHVRRYAPSLLVIESTVPPKTMEEVVMPILEERGFYLGDDIFLAYCPERAMPGRLLQELSGGNRIIGVIDELSGKLTEALYSSFTEGNIRITHFRTAELVKLVENSYRDVNIAFANAVALACEALDVDVDEVRALANLHPRVNILKPGIGVGGSCLTKDPYFLLNSVSSHGINLDLIRVARKLNEMLPKHAAELIVNALKAVGKRPEESLVAVLGITYKGNVQDCRNSPALELIYELKERGFSVRAYDPLVNEAPSGVYICRSLEEAVKGADCIVIGAEHSQLLKINLDEIQVLCRDSPVFFDGKHAFDRKAVEEAGFEYLSVGCPANVIEILKEIAEHHIHEP